MWFYLHQSVDLILTLPYLRLLVWRDKEPSEYTCCTSAWDEGGEGGR